MFTLLAEFFFPLIALIFISFSFYYNDCRSYGVSTSFMVLSAAALGWFFKTDIEAMIAVQGAVPASLYFIGVYIIGGVLTSFIYWIFYCFKAKERFDEYFNRVNEDHYTDAQKMRLKYEIIDDTSKRRKIFDDPNGELNIHIPLVSDKICNGIGDLEILTAAVGSVLPPRFNVCKKFIIGAAISWPITLIWLLLSRVVKQLIERIISTFGGFFNQISKLAFGKF